MTLALRLAQQGKAVTLFEASPSLGGLAGTWQLGDVVWDRHYHVSLSSDGYLRSLLRELGLETEIRWATTRTGFYVDSELYSLSTTLEFLKFPILSLWTNSGWVQRSCTPPELPTAKHWKEFRSWCG